MHIDFQQILSSMGPAALAVVSILGLFGLYTLAIFFERLWVFMKVRRTSAQFAPVASRFLQKGDHASLAKAGAADGSNYLGQLLSNGVKTYLDALRDPSPDISPVELARRELQRQADVTNQKLRRGLSGLASVGSTGPFVGLLGTVLGIIEAFAGIAESGSGGIGAVSAGIAEALVVTAFGLMVAIPAVLVFNFLTTRADHILLAIDQARGEFTDYLEAHHTRTQKSNVSSVSDAA
jgi:biopolymer transport protein ExbB